MGGCGLKFWGEVVVVCEWFVLWCVYVVCVGLVGLLCCVVLC